MSAGFMYSCYCGGACGGSNRVKLLCADCTVQYLRCRFMLIVLPYVCMHVCMHVCIRVISTFVITYTYISYVIHVVYILYIHIVSCDTGCAAELGTTRSYYLYTHLQLPLDP